MEKFKPSHDLRLPDWGPYTKKYIGISHIPNLDRGMRFDLSVIPGFYRRKLDVPNVMWESGYHPWESTPDFRYFSHRHELEWKDQVYVDVSFTHITDHVRLIRCACINQTDDPQNLVLHLMASLHFPQKKSHGDLLRMCDLPSLPSRSIWLDALDYLDLSYASPRPSDGLVWDGQRRAEERIHDFVNGSGIGQGFGKNKGDQVVYDIRVPESISNAVLLTRFQLDAGATIHYQATGLYSGPLTLKGTGEITTCLVPVGEIRAGEHTLQLVSEGGTCTLLDGFVILSQEQVEEVRFEPSNRQVIPKIMPGPVSNSIILKYEAVDIYYGITWMHEEHEVREIYSDELDMFLRHFVHDHVKTVFQGNGKGHFSNVYLRPVLVSPRSQTDVYAMVCCGTLEEVSEAIHLCPREERVNKRLVEEASVCLNNEAVNSSGERFQFSQQLMRATTLTNVVFPVYTKRSYIRHYTPGRWWDCLYTWDSGFIGLGLTEMDTERAIDCLNAYVTELGDPQTAFIHHGSLVPVQHYLFLELWNRTGSRELLEHFYPKLRQYYRFLAGYASGSTTRTLASNLMRPWDYFYNSGGWDDYPAQKAVHRQGLTQSVTPVSNTCHNIRLAKILRMAAIELTGHDEDVLEYEQDIRMFAEAVQTYGWDEESGYFGYVVHDENGNPQSILRHESGANYNMGMDGAYPLVAGICTSHQEKRLIGRLTSADGMWTPIGLSTVDRSAPYYRKDGYWNGAVWMPHQWFYWKTMLDLGYADFARLIAQTGLELWQKEVERTYNCYEHFVIETGRGAGWHQFGGLSTPIMAWFSSYYRPGRLTFGFDTWVREQSFAEDFIGCAVSLIHYGSSGKTFSMLAVLNENYKYRATCDGEEVGAAEIMPGTLQIQLPAKPTKMTVRIFPC